LVIPKIEVDYIFDLDSETFLNLMSFSKQVAVAIKKAIPCKRISLQVIGLEVPHAHVHLIPINTIANCNFANDKLKFTTEEFNTTAIEISKNINNLS
jgi:histidine triad (HIT) family protein